MKALFALMIIAVMFAGCSKNNPVSTDSASISSGEAAYSAVSMYKVAGDSTATTDTTVCPHDSLRNVNMLVSLKTYLTLSDEQFTLVQGFGDTLFAQLKAIRTTVKSHGISKDSSHVLVDAARAQFVASVQAILTTDQLTLFTTWLSLYWVKPGTGGPHGSFGEHGRPGGDMMANDSLKNAAMLDSLKVYLSLTDIQATSIKALSDSLAVQLKAIRALAMSQKLTPDSVGVLVMAAKTQFIASVKAVLTADQVTLFETWLTLYWEKQILPGRNGGGPGMSGGPGMHDGGHGHHGGMH